MEARFLGLLSREPNIVTLTSGDILFNKGDAGQTMYVVLSGNLRVGDGNVIYEDVTPGGVIGEMALIEHAPRSATVTATTDCTLAEINEKRFLFLTQQTPGFALAVMRILSSRLRRMDALTSV